MAPQHTKYVHFFIVFTLIIWAHSVCAQTAGFTPDKTSGCSPLRVNFTNNSTGATSYLWNFGNGNTSTVTNPTASFINPGTYTVSLTAYSGSLSNTVSQTITVFANPSAAFTSDKIGECVNGQICFTDQSVKGTGNINNWQWDFGDGGISTSQNPCHTYTFNDTFKVTLVVKDMNGCQSVLIKDDYITIIAPPSVDFSADNTAHCRAPFTVNFKDKTTPADSGYTYEWIFGDGGSSTAKNPSHTYFAVGSFSVTLKVTAPNGCSKSLKKDNLITIHDPDADFIITGDSVGCPPLNVQLKNTSVNKGPVSYLWTTSNGRSYTVKDANFTFDDPGIYSITLTVSAMPGCADSLTKKRVIKVLPRPDMTASIDPIAFCSIPATVHCRATLNNTQSVVWYFGDGTTSTQTNPDKVYNKFGTYGIKLVGQNSVGCKDSIIFPDSVRIGPSGFVLSKDDEMGGCPPYRASLNPRDTGTVPFTDWSWYINGSYYSSLPYFLNTFTDPGKYVVTCYAQNSFGCSQYSFVTIYVDTPPAIPRINIPDSAFCRSELVKFGTEDTTASLEWDFGDGTYATGRKPTHQYPNAGKYRVKVTAKNRYCESYPAYADITINYPVAAFRFFDSTICLNDTVQFADSSLGANKWFWKFGDGDTSTIQHPIHKFNKAGAYTVTLQVWDTTSGCDDIVTGKLFIPDTPLLAFTLLDTIGCSPLTVTFKNKTVFPPSTVKAAEWRWFFDDKASPVVSKKDTFKLTFTSPGYINVMLELLDKNGCFYDLRKDSAIRIYQGSVNFTLSPAEGCSPLHVDVYDHSVSESKIMTRKWIWGTGDSLVTNNNHSSYLYKKLPADQNLGFPLTLVVTDSLGCKYSNTQLVKPSKPFSRFGITHHNACGYDSIYFSADKSASAGYGPLAFRWKIGDDEYSIPEFTKAYTNTDTSYLVKLLVTDMNNCLDSASQMLSIKSKAPIAGFYATPATIKCPGPPVFFIDTSIVGLAKIISWEWDFGDQGRSNLQNPSRTYIIPGTYDISLKITDSMGCVSQIKKPGYVIIGGPWGSYSFTPKTGCSPLEVSFNAISPNAKKLEWDLADGTLDLRPVHKHTYTRAGIYIPNVTLTDSAGCKIGLPPRDTIVVYPLPEPDFEPNRTIACRDNIISFTNTSHHDKPITNFFWDFGDNDTLSSSASLITHPYFTTGRFNVSLTATDTLGCKKTITKDNLLLVLYDTIPPIVPNIYRATVIDNTNVLMQFNSNPEIDFLKYTLFYDFLNEYPMSEQDKFDVADTNYTQPGVNTLENRYSYAVSVTDVCLNQSDKSSVHTTIELKAKGVINAVQLNWSAYKGWADVDAYEVYRLNEDSGYFIKLSQVDGQTTTYIDTSTYCFKTFYYRIKGIEKNGFNQHSWSDTSGAQPIFQTTVPATRNIRATVVNNSYVLLQWYKRTHKIPFTYVVYRAVDQGEFLFYKELSSTDTSLLDESVDVSKSSYSYLTYLRDHCGGLGAPSNLAKTILLNVDLRENDVLKYNPEVYWSPYRGWYSGTDFHTVQFQYDSLRGFADIGQTDSNELSFFHQYVNNEQRTYCYKVTAFQKDSNHIFSESNVACVATAPRLYAPNVFTVNSDNLNETFRLGGVFLDGYRLQIYNRYGQLIFESDDIHKSWDGTFEGKLCAPDVYVYIAKGWGLNNQMITLKGNVTLLR